MNKVNILSRQDIVSSNIKSIGYDPGTNTLEVEFRLRERIQRKFTSTSQLLLQSMMNL